MGDEDKVVITIKDIYGELKELVIEVRRLAQHYDSQEKIDADHERRIRSLEAWKYGIPITSVVAIAGIIMQLVKG